MRYIYSKDDAEDMENIVNKQQGILSLLFIPTEWLWRLMEFSRILLCISGPPNTVHYLKHFCNTFVTENRIQIRRNMSTVIYDDLWPHTHMIYINMQSRITGDYNVSFAFKISISDGRSSERRF